MTKLEALIALRDKVKAGSDQWSAHTIYLALGGHYGKWFYRANHGSLDAAKALHEAVLPGWAWTIQDDCEQTVWPPNELADEEWCAEGITAVYPLEDNPALAWFLAILEALIAKEQQ